ncbi:MAG: hypothetical protein PHV07_05540, partial [Oscillospiraceae bacterium]|nr:hypothetical protein [Oscillospiraceae bacterium]
MSPIFIGVIMDYLTRKLNKKIQLEEATQSRTVMHEVFEWVDCIVAAIVVVVILFTFIFRP